MYISMYVGISTLDWVPERDDDHRGGREKIHLDDRHVLEEVGGWPHGAERRISRCSVPSVFFSWPACRRVSSLPY